MDKSHSISQQIVFNPLVVRERITFSKTIDFSTDKVCAEAVIFWGVPSLQWGALPVRFCKYISRSLRD